MFTSEVDHFCSSKKGDELLLRHIQEARAFPEAVLWKIKGQSVANA
jgi:hypothetical protein